MPKGLSSTQNDIIFTGFTSRGPHSSGSNMDELGESESDLDLNSNGDYQEPKICLDLLKTMITTVLDTDSHLFTPAEINVMHSFQDLSVHAQHLFVFLAIHPKWHRLESLKLVDIPWGDLSCTIAELCRCINDPAMATVDSPAEIKPHIKSEPMDVCVKMEETVLDLSASVHVKQEVKQEVKLEVKSEPKLEFPSAIPGPSDETKFQPNAAAGPSTLFPSPRPNPNPPSLCVSDSELTLRQLLEYMEPAERRDIATQMKVKTGKKKMDLIASILETSTTQRPITSFFSKGKAKAGPENQDERLREMIMKKLKNLVKIPDDVLDILLRIHVAYFRSTELPSDILPRPLRHLQRTYPKYARARVDKAWPHREMLIEHIDSLKAEAHIGGVFPPTVPPADPSPPEKIIGKRKRLAVDEEVEVKDKKAAAAVGKAKATKALLDEVYGRWVEHHALAKREIARPWPGLERLEPGCALTRAVHKGVHALKALKEPDLELDAVEQLLKQDFWCRRLRGPWHIRTSNILMEKTEDSEAILAITKGLAEGTSQIYRHPLITNLAKLQKRLQVEDPVEIPEPAKASKFVYRAERVATTEKKKICEWKSEDGDVGSIETLVSQHYEVDFKRVIPGGSLLTTLFTLLFWDIIFMPVVGVWETDFQTCPLDLCEDTFYSSRRAAIDLRLSDIKRGKARSFLDLHDRQHRATKVAAVGVRWDLCPRKDLAAVVECIPPGTLSAICEMFYEHYVEACVGAPDLIAWDAEREAYKLVHIKAPGYPCTKSKKAWRDVLARGETDQEICEVVEPGKEKKPRKKKTKKDAASDSEDDELESEEEDSSQNASGSRSLDEDEEYRPKNSKRRKIGHK
ncbi:hypothetical protein DFH06DRAFT_1159187 [Mycena polygramma]|nr:hypothetical protein DFH06DRAFT_1159187 [Mycena polygramma]